eukprot:235730-Chlamydomonas_euryale.AAC.2
MRRLPHCTIQQWKDGVDACACRGVKVRRYRAWGDERERDVMERCVWGGWDGQSGEKGQSRAGGQGGGVAGRVNFARQQGRGNNPYS